MNAAHYHLLLNHIPVLTSMFSFAILVWGMAIKNQAVKRVALVGFVIAGVTVFAVFESGESAEDIVEDIATVSHDTIEEHEEAADVSKWLTVLLGLGGLGGLIMDRRQIKGLNTVLIALAALAIVTAASLAYTGYLGGHIRHTEISGNTNVSDNPDGGSGSHEVDDD